jgi:hypothetical protein
MHFREIDNVFMPFLKIYNRAAKAVNNLASSTERIKGLALPQSVHISLAEVTAREASPSGWRDEVAMEYPARNESCPNAVLNHAAAAEVVASPELKADPRLAEHFAQIAKCQEWFKYYMGQPLNQPENRLFGPWSFGVSNEMLVVYRMPYHVPGGQKLGFSEALKAMKHVSHQRGPNQGLRNAVGQFNRAVFSIHHTLNEQSTFKGAVAKAAEWFKANGKGDLLLGIKVNGAEFNPQLFRKFVGEKTAEVAKEQAAGVSAITDADLTKYKQAIAATIENVDPSQIEITRLRRLTDSVVLKVTISSPTAEIADLVENALSATNFASELSTELSTRSITASLTIDATTISKTNLNTTGVFASDESSSESEMAEQAAEDAANDEEEEEPPAKKKKGKEKGKKGFSMPSIPSSIEDCIPGMDFLASLFPKDLEFALAGAAEARIDDPDVPPWVKATIACLKTSVFPSLVSAFEDLHYILVPTSLPEGLDGDLTFVEEQLTTGFIDIGEGSSLPEADKKYQAAVPEPEQKIRSTWGFGSRVKTHRSLLKVFDPVSGPGKKLSDNVKDLEKLLKKGDKLLKLLPAAAFWEVAKIPGRFATHANAVAKTPFAVKRACFIVASSLVDLCDGFGEQGGGATGGVSAIAASADKEEERRVASPPI